MSEDNLAGDLSGDESAAAAEVEGASDDADAAAAEVQVADAPAFENLNDDVVDIASADDIEAVADLLAAALISGNTGQSDKALAAYDAFKSGAA